MPPTCRAAGKSLTIGKSLLGVAKARYGLFKGSSSAKPVTIEFRAFQFAK